VNVRWNPGWERQILHDPQVDHVVAEGADLVVQAARARAPKRTGAGAASIHKERRGDGYAVSWDPAHDYMRFLEFGTEEITPRPFLRPAANAVGR
jgi:HK97 gp10 family phage protein